jgi:hypothetical protein
MKGYWNNLRSLEKRLVVGVGAMMFVILNFWFVVPHFSDWGKVQSRTATARKTLEVREAKVAQKSNLQRLVAGLEREGLAVPQEEQTVHFPTTIQSAAAIAGVGIPSSGRVSARTNQWFVEQSQIISIQSKEQPLVDFLYNLGSGNSLIRVRDLRLHTDPPRQQLQGDVKLVASYQKKVLARTGSSTPAPAPKPVEASVSPAKPAPTKPAPAPVSSATKSPTNAPPGSLPASQKPKPLNLKKS